MSAVIVVAACLVVAVIFVAAWDGEVCQYCNDDGLPCLQCGAGRRKGSSDA